MLHERQHEAVTREAQAMAVREAKRNLRWATYPHAGQMTPASGREAGQEALMRRVSEDLTRALEKAIAYDEAENARPRPAGAIPAREPEAVANLRQSTGGD